MSFRQRSRPVSLRQDSPSEEGQWEEDSAAIAPALPPAHPSARQPSASASTSKPWSNPLDRAAGPSRQTSAIKLPAASLALPPRPNGQGFPASTQRTSPIKRPRTPETSPPKEPIRTERSREHRLRSPPPVDGAGESRRRHDDRIKPKGDEYSALRTTEQRRHEGRRSPGTVHDTGARAIHGGERERFDGPRIDWQGFGGGRDSRYDERDYRDSRYDDWSRPRHAEPGRGPYWERDRYISRADEGSHSDRSQRAEGHADRERDRDRDRLRDRGRDRERSRERGWDPYGDRGKPGDDHRIRGVGDGYRPPRSPDRSPKRKLSKGRSEEKELGEVEETPLNSRTPPPPTLPERPIIHSSTGPIKIKNRPTNRSSRENLSKDRPDTPPPPPSLDLLPPPPPPPDDEPPPASPPQSGERRDKDSRNGPLQPQGEDVINGHTNKGYTANNQTSRSTPKETHHEPVFLPAHPKDTLPKPTSVPHAPNRNLLQPPTRVSTPNGKSEPNPYESIPKTFTRPTPEEELRNMKKSFFGTTTLDSYDVGLKLGEGTFGVVTKGVQVSTKRAIALKKLITHNPRDGVSVTTVREIKILKSLDHPNIVPIIDMVVERKIPGDRSNRGEVFMVFPFMDHDLCGLLMNHDFKITHSIAKLFMKQILEGMAYIHANNFVHRDIKSANILVDRTGLIMIADFGLARSWSSDTLLPPHLSNEYTNMVVTRWYRAPELLLGDVHYGPAVDMWSIGCVLGELYNREPILAGDTDRDQLQRIFSRCGAPNQDSFPGWDSLPGFPDAKDHPWHETLVTSPMLELAYDWQMDRPGADLMMKLLTLDPKKRFTAEEALDHPWFWIHPKAIPFGSMQSVESSHEMTTRQKKEPVVSVSAVRPQPVQNYQPSHQNHRPRQSWASGGAQQPPYGQNPSHHNQHFNQRSMMGGGGGGGGGMPSQGMATQSYPSRLPLPNIGFQGHAMGYPGQPAHNMNMNMNMDVNNMGYPGQPSLPHQPGFSGPPHHPQNPYGMSNNHVHHSSSHNGNQNYNQTNNNPNMPNQGQPYLPQRPMSNANAPPYPKTNPTFASRAPSRPFLLAGGVPLPPGRGVPPPSFPLRPTSHHAGGMGNGTGIGHASRAPPGAPSGPAQKRPPGPFDSGGRDNKRSKTEASSPVLNYDP